MKTCCIYLSSRPYKEDYQVSRISQKGCRRPLPSPLAKFSNIKDFQSRIIEWTSWENSQATKHCLDFCMTWRKKTVALKHLLAFWRRPHVRDCFNSVCWNVFHSKESSLKTHSLQELRQQWSKGAAARGKEGVPYHKLELVQQSGISLNLRTGPTGHATLFNQWEGALVFINKQIKTSPLW